MASNAVTHPAHPNTVEQAEAMFEDLGLTVDVIRKAITVADQEDARIHSEAHDPTHRGVNRWGNTLATLRLELVSHGWDWERKKPTLRSVLAPGGRVQVCVAAAKWVDGIPRTLPRGWYTIEAVENNRQMSLPNIDVLPERPPTVTWILCFQPSNHAANDPGGLASTEYRYELSQAQTIEGSGNKKRVVSWSLRCFEGTIRLERTAESLPPEDEYDAEGTDSINDMIEMM